MKKYQMKIYRLDGTFKLTLPPTDIISDISFGKNINGGLTVANIELNRKMNDTSISEGDVVQIKVFDENNTTGKIIYTGVVNGINRLQNTSKETITLICMGMTSLLAQIIYESGSKVFSKNLDPADIIKDVIDYANTVYTGGWFSYSGGNINTYGTLINIDYNYTTCLAAINDALATTNFWRYLDQSGQVFFQEKPVTPTHSLTNKKDVEMINTNENITDLVNKLHVQRSGGIFKVYTDATSQATYGVKELKIDKTDLIDEASQDSFGNNYILENKDPKKESKIVVNSKYDIESIKPGDTIRILNSTYTISNLQVLKIDYTPERIVLSLDKLVTFASEVNKGK